MNYDDLKTLDELRRTGAISEEEYQKEKEKFFNRKEDQPASNANPLLGLTENSYIALMHVSQFAGIIIPGLGFATPVVLWLMNKDNNERVNTVGKHIINFIISMFIYYVVAGILCCLLVGFAMLAVLGIVQVVFIIMATVKANNGETWKYPFTIDFLK